MIVLAPVGVPSGDIDMTLYAGRSGVVRWGVEDLDLVADPDHAGIGLNGGPAGVDRQPVKVVEPGGGRPGREGLRAERREPLLKPAGQLARGRRTGRDGAALAGV